MHRRRRCMSCSEFIFKAAKADPHICRICEYEMKEMDMNFPSYFLGN